MAPKERLKQDGIAPQLLADVIELALNTLPFAPSPLHHDDLRSDGRLAVALHVMNGGRQDKALLVKIAKCAMVNWLRANKQRFQAETAMLDTTESKAVQKGLDWEVPTAWTRTPDPPPEPKPRKHRLVLNLDDRFRGSAYFYGTVPPPPESEQEREARYEAEHIAAVLRNDVESLYSGFDHEHDAIRDPAEIARILTARGSDASAARVKELIQEITAEDRYADGPASLDADIADLAKQGLTQAQIGAALGISQVAVSKRVRQIKVRYEKWKADGQDKL